MITVVKTRKIQTLAVSYVAVALVVAASYVLSSAQETKVDAPLPHKVGQSVTPSYEGWYQNPDGTYSLVWGYFNRNHEEFLSIPVGPNNRIAPGSVDSGQPTYFIPRRQTGVFAVVVPQDFGDQQITWTLTSHGETISIPGHLRPEWEITALEEDTSGNTPPVIKFGTEAGSGQGPLGVRSALQASSGTPVELAVRVSDDGVQKRQTVNQPKQLGLVWSKYRGPGDVEFQENEPAIGDDGLAVTNVTFSMPGDYVLRVLAWDDSGGQGLLMAGGFFCCWTNGYVDVTVE